MANNNETIKYTTKAQFEISFGVPIPSSGGNDLLGIILSPLEDLYKEALRYFILREIEKAKIDISQIPNYPKDADYFVRDRIKNDILDKREEFFKNNPIEAYKQQLKDVFVNTGIQLKIEDIIAENPDKLNIIFSEEVRKEINDSVANYIANQKGLIDKALAKKIAQNEEAENRAQLAEDIARVVEETGIGELPINEAILRIIENLKDRIKEMPQNEQPLDIEKIIPDNLQNELEDQQGSIKNHNELVKAGTEMLAKYGDRFDILEGAVAMAGDGLVAGAGVQRDYMQSAKGTVDQLKNEADGLQNLDPNLQSLAKSNENVAQAQEQMNQRIGDSSAVVDEASGSIDGYVDTIEKVQNTGGFFDGIKQGFIDFVENVESNSELMADFFADTLSNMSQNFSDFFYNAVTGKFESLADVAKNAFKSILKSFLDMVSAIATRQIVISIGGLFGIGKTAQAAGGGGNAADIAQQGAGVVGSGLGLFGSGGAFSTLGQGLGIVSPGIGLTGEIGPLGVPIIGELAGPGFMATAGAAVTVVGAVLAAAALAFTIIAPFLKKTPRLDIEFDEVKNSVEERAAVVAEFLDPDFYMENIGQVSVKRGGVGIGAGGSNQILELIRERIEETIEGIQDIIAKLPTDMFRELNETLLGAEIDIDTVIAGERLLEFDAKGKKIAEKFQAFIEGELPAKFFASIRESFFEPAFRALGVSAEGTEWPTWRPRGRERPVPKWGRSSSLRSARSSMRSI